MIDKLKTVVKRSEWLRGEGGIESTLLRHDGKKCCLGFRALQKGEPARLVRKLRMPQEWENDSRNEKYNWIKFAARENDRQDITDAEREAALVELFREAGEEIEFVD